MATPMKVNQLSVKDIPDDSQLYFIKTEVGMKWKDLARKLGFSEAHIGVLEHKHRDPRESCMEMLHTWRLMTGHDGTIDILKEALLNAELKGVADNLDANKALVVPPGMLDNQTACDNQEGAAIENSNTAESSNMWRGFTVQLCGMLMTAAQQNVPGFHDVSPELPLLAAAPTGVHDTSALEGSGGGSSEGSLREQMLQFNSRVHGSQLCIENNGSVARSQDSFNNSVCFSSMPIKIGEKVNLKIIDSRSFFESLRFGFTSEDPDSITVEELPPHSYPALAEWPGFWVKPFPGSQAHQGGVITFTLEESGNVTFAVDGEDKGLFFSGVDISKPLWAVVDVHGSAVAVQLVDESAASVAFDQWIHEGDQVQLLEVEIQTLRAMQRRHDGFESDMEQAIGEVGIATRIDSNEEVHVFFPSINKGWCMSSDGLQKVKTPDLKSDAVIVGDLVKVTTDLEIVKSAQKEQVTWMDDMLKITADMENVHSVQKEEFIYTEDSKKILGQIGRVKGVGKNGDIVVRLAGEEINRTLKPNAVQKIQNQGDMCAERLHYWKRGVSKVCMKCGECTAEGAKCSMKDKPLRLPGSCCGCRSKDAGCADCGLCKSCAGEAGSEHWEVFKSWMIPAYQKFVLDSGLIDWIDESDLERGDEVKVTMDSDTFRRLQGEKGLFWHEDMVKIIGVPGTVTLHLGNHVLVLLHNGAWMLLFAGCLTKTSGGTVESIKKGDLVRLTMDEQQLKQLHTGQNIGGYKTKMLQCLGKTGCVKRVRKRLVQVQFPFLTAPLWISRAALTKVPSEEEREVVHDLKAGDCVKVAVDAETFKANQLGHGGPIPAARNVMETAGIIKYVDMDGDLFISFQNGMRWMINPASLQKVNPEDNVGEDNSKLTVGHWVKVDADKTRIKQVQTTTVNWNKIFYVTAGKVGMVTEIVSSKIVRVTIRNVKYPLNPVLLKRASLADMQEEIGRGRSSEFARGDLVRISVSLDELKSLQDGHGGYKVDMEKVMLLGQPGAVSFIDHDGDVYVRFSLKGLYLNPAALTKVTIREDKFYVGDLVYIESNLERFKSLQTPMEYGGYVEQMATLCGKTGRVVSIVDSKKLRVKVLGIIRILNPDLLRKMGNSRAAWKSATICAPGKHDWSNGRSLVCFVCGECTEHGRLCRAPGRPNSTPGSVAPGCQNGHAGCDDCGACRTCAGEGTEGLDMLDLNIKLMKSLVKNIGDLEKQQHKTPAAVDASKLPLNKHRQSDNEDMSFLQKMNVSFIFLVLGVHAISILAA